MSGEFLYNLFTSQQPNASMPMPPTPSLIAAIKNLYSVAACRICHRVVPPFQVSVACDHHFCRDCILVHVAVGGVCPDPACAQPIRADAFRDDPSLNLIGACAQKLLHIALKGSQAATDMGRMLQPHSQFSYEERITFASSSDLAAFAVTPAEEIIAEETASGVNDSVAEEIVNKAAPSQARRDCQHSDNNAVDTAEKQVKYSPAASQGKLSHQSALGPPVAMDETMSRADAKLLSTPPPNVLRSRSNIKNYYDPTLYIGYGKKIPKTCEAHNDKNVADLNRVAPSDAAQCKLLKENEWCCMQCSNINAKCVTRCKVCLKEKPTTASSPTSAAIPTPGQSVNKRKRAGGSTGVAATHKSTASYVFVFSGTAGSLHEDLLGEVEKANQANMNASYRENLLSVASLEKQESQTHHILLASVDEEGCCKRTLKYLCAVAAGIAVLRTEYLDDSVLAKRWLDWDNYLVHGDTSYGGASVTQAIGGSVRREPLFVDWSVYLFGEFSKPAKKDVAEILKYGRCKILPKLPKIVDKEAHIAVVCDLAVMKKEASWVSACRADGLRVETSSWLLDEISKAASRS